MNKLSWMLAATAVAMLGTSPVRAADHVSAEATAFMGYRMGGSFDLANPPAGVDSSVDLKDSSSWGLDLGLYRDSNSFYEFLYSNQNAGVKTDDPTLKNTDVKVEYWQIGGTLLYPVDTFFVPYLSLTIGATRFDASKGGSSETKFSGSLGGGFRFPFNDNFGALLGARGYLTAVSSDTDYFCSGGGGSANCLFHTTGSTLFQGEVLIGLTGRF